MKEAGDAGLFLLGGMGLLELEGNGEGVCYLYRLAVVTTGHPFGHCLYDAKCFFVEGLVTGTNNANVGDGAVFANDELDDYTTLDAVFDGGCGEDDVIAKPFVHCGFAAGELGFLLYHSDADGLVFNDGSGDDLFFDGDLVKVIGAFGDVDGADGSFVIEHVFLVLDLLVFFDFVIFGDEEVGNLLLVGNFLGGDDFFGFGGQLEVFFLFHFFFFGFLLEGGELLGSSCYDLLFFGLGEYAGDGEDKED